MNLINCFLEPFLVVIYISKVKLEGPLALCCTYLGLRLGLGVRVRVRVRVS